MDNFYFIYKTTNLINNKIYVGKHIQYETSAFDGYLGSGKIIKQAIKKYGRGNFIRETVEICSLSNVDEREIYWIAELSATVPKIGYNLTNGGEGNLGYLFTQEDKLKMSKKLKGNKHLLGHKHSDESKSKMSKSHYGRKHTNSTIIKIKNNHKGMNGLKHSEETKIKMKEIHNKIKIFGDKNSSCKYIYTLDNNKEYWTFFTQEDKKKIKWSFNNHKSNKIIYKDIQIERKLK